MPSIICTSCGHRIILPAPTSFCPNCGASFAQSAIPGSPTPGGGQQQQMMGLAAIPQAQRQNAAPPNPIIVTAGVPGGGAGAGVGSMPPPGGYASPPRMPRRPPELEGVVLNMQTFQMEEAMGQFSVVKLLRDILWPSYEQTRMANPKRTTVTTIRVRNSMGEERDARMEGDITSGSLNMGDTLSIWGRTRKGTLRVRKLYNCTSKAQVTTRLQTGSTITSMIVTMVVIVAVVFVLMYVLQNNSSALIP